jgi:hypothetical protein
MVFAATSTALSIALRTTSSARFDSIRLRGWHHFFPSDLAVTSVKASGVT